MVKWLGVIDRRAARTIPGATEVMLDFAAFQLGLLDPVQWLAENTAIVGCLIDEGVMAVTDGKTPLIKPWGAPSA
jgi:hypothetical protein